MENALRWQTGQEDERGRLLQRLHATKGSRRYRYYVSKSLIRGTKSETPHGRRIPAGDIEGLVTSRMEAFLPSAHEMHQDHRGLCVSGGD